MSAIPVDPTNQIPIIDVTPDDPSRIRCRTGMTRLGIALALGGMSWTIPFGAATAVLLPARVAGIDAAHKVPLLAAITITGSIAALLANIIFGTLSDLARSRFGRRAPWLERATGQSGDQPPDH